MELYDRLKKYRKNANLSQQDVADKLNITRQTVSGWETGKSTPDLNSIVLLGQLYQVSLDELLRNEQDEQVTAVVGEEKREEMQGEGKEQKEEKRLEWNNQILLFVLLVVSALTPPLGIVVPIVVLFRYGKKKQLETIIKVLCVLCIVASIYNFVIGLNSWFDFFAYSNVQISD